MAFFKPTKPLSFERRMAKGAPWLLILVAVLALIVLWGIIASISAHRQVEVYRKNEVQKALASFSDSLTAWMQPALVRRLSLDAVVRHNVYCYRITDETGTPVMPDYSYSPVPVPPSKYLAFVQQRLQDTDLSGIPAASLTNTILYQILNDRVLAEQLKNDAAIRIEMGWRLAAASSRAHAITNAQNVYALLISEYPDYIDAYGFPVKYTAGLEDVLLTISPDERRRRQESWLYDFMQKMNPALLTNAESVISVLLSRADTGNLPFSFLSLTNWFFPSSTPSCSYSYNGTNYTAWLNPGPMVDWLRKDWLPGYQAEASNTFVYLRLRQPSAPPPVGEAMETNIFGISMSIVPFDAITWEARRKEKAQMQILLLSVLLGVLSLLAWRSIIVIGTERNLKKRQLNFVAAVSHELRTPVATVRTLAETMQRGLVTDPGEQQEYTGMIIAESDRLTRLVDNILDVANNSRLKASLHKQDITVSQLFDGITSMITKKYPGVSFRVDTDPELVVHVDREAMERVFYNLVDNAVKYSQPDHTALITLSATREKNKMVLSVADNGIGIARNEQDKIFDRFYRVGDELIRDNPGAGLGLAIVKEIVEAHDGIITVQSEPGVGSVFSVHLKQLTDNHKPAP